MEQVLHKLKRSTGLFDTMEEALHHLKYPETENLRHLTLRSLGLARFPISTVVWGLGFRVQGRFKGLGQFQALGIYHSVNLKIGRIMTQNP